MRAARRGLFASALAALLVLTTVLTPAQAGGPLLYFVVQGSGSGGQLGGNFFLEAPCTGFDTLAAAQQAEQDTIAFAVQHGITLDSSSFTIVQAYTLGDALVLAEQQFSLPPLPADIVALLASGCNAQPGNTPTN